MRIIKLVPFPVVMSIALSGLAATVPAGWKVLIDKTKNCQIAVPADWVPNQLSPSMSDSADKKSSVAMHGTNQGQTLEQAKSVIEQMFPPTKVIEDSKTRLWYAYKGPNDDEDSPPTNWYVGIPSNGNVCGAQMNFKNPSAEPVMKQIAESLAPGR
jgi:hypothetical protein